MTLRELSPADADFFYKLNADPEVMRYTGDAPFASEEEARSFLSGYDAYERFGMGRWAMVAKDDGRLLGWCGLKTDAESGEVDLGFRLFRRKWGLGYASEAAEACLAWGHRQAGLPRILGRVMVGNIASVRVLEKIGMTRIGPGTCGGEQAILFESLLSIP